ncbi:Uncharacterised protein [Corynebacterium urealyticum]|nr:Uncharacterised protein [Corynebacterium urealyticum]
MPEIGQKATLNSAKRTWGGAGCALALSTHKLGAANLVLGRGVSLFARFLTLHGPKRAGERNQHARSLMFCRVRSRPSGVLQSVFPPSSCFAEFDAGNRPKSDTQLCKTHVGGVAGCALALSTHKLGAANLVLGRGVSLFARLLTFHGPKRAGEGRAGGHRGDGAQVAGGAGAQVAGYGAAGVQVNGLAAGGARGHGGARGARGYGSRGLRCALRRDLHQVEPLP